MEEHREGSAEQQEIQLFIQQIRKRLACQRLLSLLVLYGMTGALFCLFCNLVILWLPVYAGAWIGFAVFFFLLLLGMIHWLFRQPKEYEAAAAGDRAGLEERLTTSLERRGQSDLMSELQRRDTVEKLREFSITDRIVIEWYPKWYAGIGLCLLLSLICALIPTPAKQLARDRHALAQVQKEAVKEIEKAEKKIEEQAGEGKLSEGEQKKVTEILDSVKQEIQSSQSESDIKKAQARLETKLVKSLPEKMSQETIDSLQPLVKGQDLAEEAEYLQRLNKLAQKDPTLAEAKASLQNLGKMLSSEQKQELMEQLEQAAADGQMTEQELAEALENLDDANASYTKAQLAEGNPAQQSGSSESSKGPECSSAAGSSKGQGNGNGSESSRGQEGSSGSGSSKEQGGSSGSGNGQGQGNGTGSGSGTGQGSGGGAGGGGYNRGSETGMERVEKASEAEQVWIPEQEGDDANLTGKKTGSSGNQQKSQTAQTGSAGKKADLAAVSGSYEQKAYSKLKKQKVPDSMEDMVKKYFSSLD